ncbi:rCG32809 [Rattus norvegicus]|uniref:RCG32809 n=1 Tax=Rattus norvegicus TaxID=10116 RepID=A6HJU1_RAT|nr:rCG32809 [Rattus norvegicus]
MDCVLPRLGHRYSKRSILTLQLSESVCTTALCRPHGWLPLLSVMCPPSSMS